MAFCTAEVEGPERSIPGFDRVLQIFFETGVADYPNLVWALKDRARAGAASPEMENLLNILANRMPEIDLRKEFRGPAHVALCSTPGSEGQTRNPFLIDLARDEYCPPGSHHLKFGIPFEVELIAWTALFRAAFERHVSLENFQVPRGVLIDLLWPGAPADIGLLDNRLSKLLARTSEVHGLELRNSEMNRISGVLPPGLELTLVSDIVKRPPSYFDKEAIPSTAGFARHYGMSESNARKVRKQLAESNLWPDPAAHPKKKAA